LREHILMPAEVASAALAVIAAAKAIDAFMTLIGRSRDWCYHGAVDVLRFGSPLCESQVLLEPGLETLA